MTEFHDPETTDCSEQERSPDHPRAGDQPRGVSQEVRLQSACCAGEVGTTSQSHTDFAEPTEPRTWANFVWNLPAMIAIFLVRIYQWTLSPIIGRQCRFQPSCSNYYILAVRKYGFLSGSFRGFWRICRCNPFCRGGIDFP